MEVSIKTEVQTATLDSLHEHSDGRMPRLLAVGGCALAGVLRALAVTWTI